MVDVRFDKYYRYDELSALLDEFAEAYPQWIQLESIGQSYEGRDIWLVTVTNHASTPASEKPALWVDGNIHASEVSPSSVCLHLIHSLMTRRESDPEVARVLETRTFYICPRVNPDGAEWALADNPRIIRSSTRPYPYNEEPLPKGWRQEDIDGDGRMLIMRIPDPNGPWKAHPDEPRLMVRRDPTEVDGTYYRVIPEGRIDDFDGLTFFPQRIKENLDLNRNFPSNWRQEADQRGAGPYPTSEPEVRAIVDFIVNHPNITGALTYHTWSGVLMRPYGTQSDDTFPAEDLWTYQKIGSKGTEITGYPAISVFHDFKYHPKEVITGVFDDWLYDHYGIYAWTVEIWSPQRQAGITDYKYIEWFREHPVEDDLKLLKWSDEVLEGQGYIDWYSFEHPQLGPVEIGGWDTLYAWRNPPPQLLEKEIAPFTDWMIWHALIAPQLDILDVRAQALGDDHYRVTAVVHNVGWLPTYVSKKALERKVVRGVIAEIELPESAQLISGKAREDIGQLEGRSGVPSTVTPWWGLGIGTHDRAKVEWVVHVPQIDEITLVVRHDRAGLKRRTIRLSQIQSSE